MKSQVTINQDVTLTNGAVIVIQNQDVVINSEITGEGKIIVKKDAEHTVTLNHKKDLSKETLNQYKVVIEDISTLSEVSDKEKFALEIEKTPDTSPHLIPTTLEKITLFGSMSLVRITKNIQPQPEPIGSFVMAQIFNIVPILFDNYFPNYNYTLITKELIMSSQNMHDTLLVKPILDPPKYLS